MGEYADMAVDYGIDEWVRYADRRPDDDEQWDAAEAPGFYRRYGQRGPKPKTCNRCGQGGLYWHETERGWRLHKLTDDPAEPALHACAPASGSEPFATSPQTVNSSPGCTTPSPGEEVPGG